MKMYSILIPRCYYRYTQDKHSGDLHILFMILHGVQCTAVCDCIWWQVSLLNSNSESRNPHTLQNGIQAQNNPGKGLMPSKKTFICLNLYSCPKHSFNHNSLQFQTQYSGTSLDCVSLMPSHLFLFTLFYMQNII